MKTPPPTKKIRSLQSQYIIVAFLLGILVLIGTTAGYFNIISTSSLIISQAETTSRTLGSTTNVRKHAHAAYQAIQGYLLDPNQKTYISDLHNEIDKAKYILDQLDQTKIAQRLNLKSQIEHLLIDLTLLSEKSNQLFATRTTPNEQYPALDISSNIMNPISSEIISILELSLLEYNEEYHQKTNSEEFLLLNKLSHDWVNTISKYRLYLTNRMGTFDPALLKKQENDVDLYVFSLKKNIPKLVNFSQQNRFGFEANILLRKIPTLINKWHLTYQDVKSINHSKKWRKDVNLLKTSISPLMNNINMDIELIDTHVKNEYQSNLKEKISTSTKQNYILVSIIFIFLAYIIISIKLLQYFIIKPIATISRIMKDDAQHHGGLHSLKLTKTKETQDLIDAFSEMSYQVYKRQDELEYQATHDSLTGLPNRLMLHQRFDQLLSDVVGNDKNIVLMMLDLNRFKDINDTLGHHIGDILLIQVGERISLLLRNLDMVSRLGGDEFAVLLPNTTPKEASVFAEKINQSLEKPFIVNDYKLNIGASIGISQFPSDGNDGSSLMQHADVAMYISKREKTSHHFYSASEDSHSIDHLSLVADLKIAIKNNTLKLHYQPQYELTSKQMIGAEALLRWEHSELGYISPEKIISIAEDTGIINELNYWVMENAISFSAQISQHEFTGAISINLSAHNLRDSNLVSKLEQYLKTYSVKSHQINFEITESAVMSDPEKSIQALNKLHQLGVNLSVDDFGTGFSSLTYLKLLPISELKIDKSFILDIENDESDQVIVKSTIDLGHSLGLKVVAEGIESESAWNTLLDMKCDIAQGYFMSRPLTKENFINLLTTPKSELLAKPEPYPDARTEQNTAHRLTRL